MIILHIVSNLTPGGAELMMKRLIAHQCIKGGFTHHVISLREKATVGVMLEAMGIPVIALGMRGPMSGLAALPRLMTHLRRLKPDVVQTWMYHADLIGGIAARLSGVRAVIWSVRATYLPHGKGTAPFTTLIRAACAALSSRVPACIVYVAESARTAHERLGYTPAKGVVITNGYEMPEVWGQASAKSAAKAKFGLPPDGIVIGSGGRYNELKDYPTLIAAAAHLSARRPDVSFALAGRGLHRDNSELVAQIEHFGLSDRFQLLGEQQGLAEFLSAVDVFCLHSTSEGFPNVVAEAMAMGVPCAVTDVGAAATIVGDTGWVVPPSRPDLLADALQKLVDEPLPNRLLRGERARARIAENFSMATIAAQYEELYTSGVREQRQTQSLMDDQLQPRSRIGPR